MSTRGALVASVLVVIAGCPRPAVENAQPEPHDLTAKPSAVPDAAVASTPTVADATPIDAVVEASAETSVTASIPTVAPPIYDPAHKCPPGMAFLAGGLFPSAPPDENDTKIASFCLDATEITERAYAGCVKAGVCKATGKPDASQVQLAACHGGATGFEDHPVNCVGWSDAVGFCKSVGKRLPTQLEWLWARRGGARGTKFPWGDTPPATRSCWSEVTKRTTTCVVGSMPGDASPEGVLDLVGNVKEWTSTQYSEAGLGIGQYWAGPDAWHTTAKTLGWPGVRMPTQIAHDTGFRCAKTPQGK